MPKLSPLFFLCLFINICFINIILINSNLPKTQLNSKSQIKSSIIDSDQHEYTLLAYWNNHSYQDFTEWVNTTSNWDTYDNDGDPSRAFLYGVTQLPDPINIQDFYCERDYDVNLNGEYITEMNLKIELVQLGYPFQPLGSFFAVNILYTDLSAQQILTYNLPIAETWFNLSLSLDLDKFVDKIQIHIHLENGTPPSSSKAQFYLYAEMVYGYLPKATDLTITPLQPIAPQDITFYCSVPTNYSSNPDDLIRNSILNLVYVDTNEGTTEEMEIQWQFPDNWEKVYQITISGDYLFFVSFYFNYWNYSLSVTDSIIISFTVYDEDDLLYPADSILTIWSPLGIAIPNNMKVYLGRSETYELYHPAIDRNLDWTAFAGQTIDFVEEDNKIKFTSVENGIQAEIPQVNGSYPNIEFYESLVFDIRVREYTTDSHLLTVGINYLTADYAIEIDSIYLNTWIQYIIPFPQFTYRYFSTALAQIGFYGSFIAEIKNIFIADYKNLSTLLTNEVNYTDQYEISSTDYEFLNNYQDQNLSNLTSQLTYHNNLTDWFNNSYDFTQFRVENSTIDSFQSDFISIPHTWDNSSKWLNETPTLDYTEANTSQIDSYSNPLENQTALAYSNITTWFNTTFSPPITANQTQNIIQFEPIIHITSGLSYIETEGLNIDDFNYTGELSNESGGKWNRLVGSTGYMYANGTPSLNGHLIVNETGAGYINLSSFTPNTSVCFRDWSCSFIGDSLFYEIFGFALGINNIFFGVVFNQFATYTANASGSDIRTYGTPNGSILDLSIEYMSYNGIGKANYYYDHTLFAEHNDYVSTGSLGLALQTSTTGTPHYTVLDKLCWISKDHAEIIAYEFKSEYGLPNSINYTLYINNSQIGYSFYNFTSGNYQLITQFNTTIDLDFYNGSHILMKLNDSTFYRNAYTEMLVDFLTYNYTTGEVYSYVMLPTEADAYYFRYFHHNYSLNNGNFTFRYRTSSDNSSWGDWSNFSYYGLDNRVYTIYNHTEKEPTLIQNNINDTWSYDNIWYSLQRFFMAPDPDFHINFYFYNISFASNLSLFYYCVFPYNNPANPRANISVFNWTSGTYYLLRTVTVTTNIWGSTIIDSPHFIHSNGTVVINMFSGWSGGNTEILWDYIALNYTTRHNVYDSGDRYLQLGYNSTPFAINVTPFIYESNLYFDYSYGISWDINYTIPFEFAYINQTYINNISLTSLIHLSPTINQNISYSETNLINNGTILLDTIYNDYTEVWVKDPVTPSLITTNTFARSASSSKVWGFHTNLILNMTHNLTDTRDFMLNVQYEYPYAFYFTNPLYISYLRMGALWIWNFINSTWDLLRDTISWVLLTLDDHFLINYTKYVDPITQNISLYFDSGTGETPSTVVSFVKVGFVGMYQNSTNITHYTIGLWDYVSLDWDYFNVSIDSTLYLGNEISLDHFDNTQMQIRVNISYNGFKQDLYGNFEVNISYWIYENTSYLYYYALLPSTYHYYYNFTIPSYSELNSNYTFYWRTSQDNSTFDNWKSELDINAYYYRYVNYNVTMITDGFNRSFIDNINLFYRIENITHFYINESFFFSYYIIPKRNLINISFLYSHNTTCNYSLSFYDFDDLSWNISYSTDPTQSYLLNLDYYNETHILGILDTCLHTYNYTLEVVTNCTINHYIYPNFTLIDYSVLPYSYDWYYFYYYSLKSYNVSNENHYAFADYNESSKPVDIMDGNITYTYANDVDEYNLDRTVAGDSDFFIDFTFQANASQFISNLTLYYHLHWYNTDLLEGNLSIYDWNYNLWKVIDDSSIETSPDTYAILSTSDYVNPNGTVRISIYTGRDVLNNYQVISIDFLLLTYNEYDLSFSWRTSEDNSTWGSWRTDLSIWEMQNNYTQFNITYKAPNNLINIYPIFNVSLLVEYTDTGYSIEQSYDLSTEFLTPQILLKTISLYYEVSSTNSLDFINSSFNVWKYSESKFENISIVQSILNYNLSSNYYSDNATHHNYRVKFYALALIPFNFSYINSYTNLYVWKFNKTCTIEANFTYDNTFNITIFHFLFDSPTSNSIMELYFQFQNDTWFLFASYPETTIYPYRPRVEVIYLYDDYGILTSSIKAMRFKAIYIVDTYPNDDSILLNISKCFWIGDQPYRLVSEVNRQPVGIAGDQIMVFDTAYECLALTDYYSNFVYKEYHNRTEEGYWIDIIINFWTITFQNLVEDSIVTYNIQNRNLNITITLEYGQSIEIGLFTNDYVVVLWDEINKVIINTWDIAISRVKNRKFTYALDIPLEIPDQPAQTGISLKATDYLTYFILIFFILAGMVYLNRKWHKEMKETINVLPALISTIRSQRTPPKKRKGKKKKPTKENLKPKNNNSHKRGTKKPKKPEIYIVPS